MKSVLRKLWRAVRPMEAPMQFSIPDITGHSTEVFDRMNKRDLVRAEKRFMELVGEQKFTAAIRSGDGERTVIKSFDPSADETVFIRPMQGG